MLAAAPSATAVARPARGGPMVPAVKSYGPGLVFDRLSKDPPLQQRHRQESHEHEHGHDRGVTHPEILEGGIVEQHDNRLACTGRPTLRRRIHLVENLKVEYKLQNAHHDDLWIQ